MRNIVVIQCRMASTRLSGKILLSLYGHMTVLEVLVERLKMSKYIDDIIIATTENSADYEIVDLCIQKYWKYYVGSEGDVLKRVCGTIDGYGLKDDNIIDITSDCVLLPIDILDEMLEIYKAENYDYYSNIVTRGFFDGADIQIYKPKLLLELNNKIKFEQHRTHTGWLILNYLGLLQKKFKNLKIGNFHAPEWGFYPDLRLVLDYPEDYILLKKIFEIFNKLDFTFKDIMILLEENSELLKINKEKFSKIPGVD